MKKCLVILLFVLTLLSTGCIKGGHIPDTNGSDTTLIRITERDILHSIYRHISYNSIRRETTKRIEQSVKVFSGILELRSFTVPEGSQKTQTIDVTLNKGNLRVVILKNNKIEINAPLNEISSYILTEGDYSIVVAGESAEFKIILTK